MNIDLIKKEGKTAEIKLVFTKEEHDKEENKVYNLIRNQIQIPGFRAGRAPKSIVYKKYGKYIEDELKDRIFRSYYKEITSKHSLNILSVINAKSEKDGENQVYVYEFEILPDIDIDYSKFEGAEIKIEKYDITEDDINEALSDLRKDHSEMKDIDGRAADTGDIIYVDFQEKLQGEWTAAKPMNTEIKEDDPFSSNLKGLKKDDDKEFSYKDESGDEKEVKVKAVNIKERILPELNDEFAKKLKKENLNELKNEIKQQLVKGKEEAYEKELEEKIYEEVLGKIEIPIPEVMIKDELERELKNLEKMLSFYRLKPDDYFKRMNVTKEEWFNEHRPSAVKNLQKTFLLHKISEKENIEVADNDLIDYMGKFDKMSGDKLNEELEKIKKDEKKLENLKYNVKLDKAYEILKDKLKITQTKGD